jgi:hypothetical protein
MPIPPENFDELVAQYVKLRDSLKAADEAHAEKTKMAKDYRSALEAKLLERLNAVGGDAISTGHGTAYRTTRRSATIKDAEVFRTYVIDQEAFDLVDWKANANAVDDFVKSEGSLPPGVNLTTAYTVGVRRA